MYRLNIAGKAQDTAPVLLSKGNKAVKPMGIDGDERSGAITSYIFFALAFFAPLDKGGEMRNGE